MTASATGLRAPHALPEGTDLACELCGPDPYPAYHRLRRDYPVLETNGAVHVFGYDDVAAVLRHPLVSADDRTSALHRSLRADGKLGPAYLSQLDDQSFLRRDPPGHTRLRKLAAAGFTPRRVEALRPFIQRQVDRAVDAAAPAGRLDLVAGLAWPLPIEVICELLGIPGEDRPFVATWPRAQLCCSFESGSLKADSELARSDPGGTRRAEADRVQQQLTSYFAGLIERRRRDPGDDLVSALIAATGGGQATGGEINATLRLLFVAGYENVVNLIGHGTLALLRHPGQWAQLRDNPALAAGAVDEALRYDPPFQFTQRIALADLEVGGYRIARGRHILLWLAAANRDPARFPDPDRFDIHRGGNHHIAFGAGIHACLGGPLARMEAEIAFATLARRLIEPRLESGPARYRTDVFRSLADLPVSFAGTREP